MLSDRAALACAVACFFHLAACGEPPSAPPASAAGAATGGTSTSALGSGGSAAGAASGASGAAGSSVGGGGSMGPPVACSGLMDQTGWSLLVQISNERDQVVYVGQRDATCETTRPFEVRDGARTLLPALEKCQSSCQQLMQGAPTACPLSCAAPSTIALQPGETVKVPWDGRFGVPQTLPVECASPAAQGTSSCVQAGRIEPSLLTFSAQAGTTRQCLAGEASCTCVPSSNGGCIAAGSVIGGTIITTEYLVKLEPGEKSPSGEPPYIGLVFRN